MPEKMIETNTVKPVEKIEDTTRRYMREAEGTARDTVRMWNDLIPPGSRPGPGRGSSSHRAPMGR